MTSSRKRAIIDAIGITLIALVFQAKGLSDGMAIGRAECRTNATIIEQVTE